MNLTRQFVILLQAKEAAFDARSKAAAMKTYKLKEVDSSMVRRFGKVVSGSR